MIERAALAPQLIAGLEAGATLLVANRRGAHWLKLVYARHAIASGRQAWATPSIQPFGEFIARIWRLRARGAERILTREQSSLLWERIVARSPHAEALLNPRDAAQSAYRSWERLIAWRLERDALRRAADAADSAEMRALSDWIETFESQCAQRRWIPEALLMQRALDIAPDNLVGFLPQRIMTLANHELTPIEQALLEHCVKSGAAWDRLAGAAPTTSTASASFVVCESNALEWRRAATWAYERRSRGCAQIAIVTPNLDMQAALARRTLADVFAPHTRTLTAESALSDREQHEAHFAIAHSWRLAEYPIVRAALDVLQLSAGRADGALVGAILRSPFLLHAQQEASARALVDLRVREQARERYDASALERLCAANDCIKFADLLRAMQAARAATPGRALPSAMAEHFSQLWRAIGWPGSESLDSDEQQAVARLQASLGEFGALDELLGPMSFTAAVRQFEQWIGNARFAPRSSPAPVTVFDAQAVDGLHFDALWLMGMDEGRWPPPARPDPFLPIELQAQAGMPFATATLARDHAARRLQTLLRQADEAVLSAATQEEGVEVAPSPWVVAMQLPELSAAPAHQDAVFTQRPRLETLEERAAPSIAAGRTRGGARVFELQSQCPFRAFAELRLHARALDEIAPGVDAAERGSLLHAALAEIWDALRDSRTLQTRTRDELIDLTRAALAKSSAKLLAGAAPHRVRMLQIEQQLACERIVALLELDKTRPAFQIVGKPETPEAVIVGPLTVELRLDRVDELLDAPHAGKRVIVDYKTGAQLSPRAWFSARPESPQLPLYAAAHPEGLIAAAFATLNAKSIGYQGAAEKADVLPGVQAFDARRLALECEDWRGLLAWWRGVIERLAQEFAAGEARVDPLPNACRRCRLSALCRVHDAGVLSWADDSAEAESA